MHLKLNLVSKWKMHFKLNLVSKWAVSPKIVIKMEMLKLVSRLQCSSYCEKCVVIPPECDIVWHNSDIVWHHPLLHIVLFLSDPQHLNWCSHLLQLTQCNLLKFPRPWSYVGVTVGLYRVNIYCFQIIWNSMVFMVRRKYVKYFHDYLNGLFQ